MPAKISIPRECRTCGAIFMARQTEINRGGAIYCSKSCAGKSRRGEKSASWRGGRIINDNGYVMIRCKGHPYGKAQGYVLEHRLVMEAHLGRYLHPSEKVHHLNNRRDDNRIENLQVITQAEHCGLHIREYHRQHPEFRLLSPEQKRVQFGKAHDAH